MRHETRDTRHELFAAAAALGLALVSMGCGTASNCGPASATVTNVVDGDTVDLDTNDRVRLLSIDAPEITNGHNDCYGQEAKTFTSDFVLNKKVTITYDAVCKDKYGRLLAYLSVDGKEVNSEAVKGGFACEYTLPPSGEKRSTEFQDYESVAKTNRVGMWGTCATVSCDHP